MKQRIALDVGVGFRRKKELEDLGYKVVVVARDSETDDSWLNRAFVEGARFAVSADLDIPRLIETCKYPMVWINYPSNDKGSNDILVKYIDDTVKFKVKCFSDWASEMPVKETKVEVSKDLKVLKSFGNFDLIQIAEDRFCVRKRYRTLWVGPVRHSYVCLDTNGTDLTFDSLSNISTISNLKRCEYIFNANILREGAI